MQTAIASRNHIISLTVDIRTKSAGQSGTYVVTKQLKPKYTNGTKAC
jgi:hypothetical protein